MRFMGPSFAVVVMVCAFPLGAQAIPVNVGGKSEDVTVTRAAWPFRPTTTKTYSRQLAADFSDMWDSLTCQTIRNLLLDGTKLNQLTQGFNNKPIDIAVSSVSCHMGDGVAYGSNPSPNQVTLVYSTSNNYIDATYSMQGMLLDDGSHLTYNPIVRLFFNADLHVTLAAPAPPPSTHPIYPPPVVPNGPVTVTGAWVTVSSIRATTGDANPNTATLMQNIVMNLGSDSYCPSPVYCSNFIGLDGVYGFQGWVKWLPWRLGDLLTVASKGFNELRIMNGFLEDSKNDGALTTKLNYDGLDGLILVSSGGRSLVLHPVVSPSPATFKTQHTIARTPSAPVLQTPTCAAQPSRRIAFAVSAPAAGASYPIEVQYWWSGAWSDYAAAPHSIGASGSGPVTLGKPAGTDPIAWHWRAQSADGTTWSAWCHFSVPK